MVIATLCNDIFEMVLATGRVGSETDGSHAYQHLSGKGGRREYHLNPVADFCSINMERRDLGHYSPTRWALRCVITAKAWRCCRHTCVGSDALQGAITLLGPCTPG